MSAFLQHIIARHTSSVPAVQPRLYNRFEPMAAEEPLAGGLNEMETQTHTVTFPQAEMISPPASGVTASQPAVQSAITGISLNEKTHVNPPEQPSGNKIAETSNERWLIPDSELPETPDGKYDKGGVHVDQSGLFTKESETTIHHIAHNNIHGHDEKIFHERQSLLHAAPIRIDTNLISEDRYKGDALNTQGHSIIKVTIGRVDVRANASAQPPKSLGTTQAGTKMSLEDYFKRKAAPGK